MTYGHENGLIDGKAHERMLDKYKRVDEKIEKLKNTSITIDEKIAEILNSREDAGIEKGRMPVAKLLRRPQIKLEQILPIIGQEMEEQEAAVVEMEIKYEGYIKRDQEQIKKMEKMENTAIPDDMDYENIDGLRREARDKLKL